MGRAKQEQPRRLPEKLRQVRLARNWTLEQMYEALCAAGAGKIYLGYITLFESGKRLTPVLVLLAYSRAVGIPMEYFADDSLDLPL